MLINQLQKYLQSISEKVKRGASEDTSKRHTIGSPTVLFQAYGIAGVQAHLSSK